MTPCDGGCSCHALARKSRTVLIADWIARYGASLALREAGSLTREQLITGILDYDDEHRAGLVVSE